MPVGRPLPRRVLSVREVAARLRTWLEGLPAVSVRGEVSNLSRSPSGHFFFTLRDERAALEVVMYRRQAVLYEQFLEEGVEVVVSGGVTFYVPGGRLQLVAESVEPAGEGARRAALLRLKRRLEAEGLFAPERKVPLPYLPGRIALVTSPRGAAVVDMVSTIRRRFPPARILVVPVRVQGEEAPAEIARALRLVDRHGLADVVVVGRGGGSVEDLAAFNTEPVVRAVAECRTPVVSAVGHEVDVTLTDLAADRRALTPTDAGRLVVPDWREVGQRLRRAAAGLLGAVRGHLDRRRHRRALLAARLAAASPAARLREVHRRLREGAGRLERAARAVLERARGRLERRAEALEARSPLAVLARGYSITRLRGSPRPLTDSAQAPAGSVLETILHRGRIASRVIDSAAD